jgi:capping protein beta
MTISPQFAARDLLRRVQPKDVEDRLYDAIKLNKSTAEELLATVDVPMKIGTDSKGNRYILCDYNRDGDSYRSPFTNTYHPSVSKPMQLPEYLRQMEIMANRGFQSYLRQYFDSGVCSVYCWECDGESFGVGVFIRKDIDQETIGQITGSICCTDVCQVLKVDAGRNFRYELVSSAMVEVKWPCRVGTAVALDGSVNEETIVEGEANGALDHLITIGGMIEGISDRFVERIRGIYVSKMKEILSYMKHDPENSVSQKAQDLLAGGLKLG